MAVKKMKLGVTKKENIDNVNESLESLEASDSSIKASIGTINGNISALQHRVGSIEQPDGTNDLIDSSTKINTTYLPDTVTGQLFYKGTWKPYINNNTAITPKKGDYYIAQVHSVMNGNATTEYPEGQYNPDNTSTGKSDYYQVGDWAVYNGATWDKIDNTDAVTTVNGQKGSVKTYKGVYVSTSKYYSGDVISYNDVLYVCIKDASSGTYPTTANASYWKQTGITTIATSSKLGLVKSTTTGTTSGKDYNVEVNSDGTMKVNVPWTDTTYNAATSSKLGLVKSTTTGTTSGKDYNVEVNSDGTMKVNVPWTDTNTAHTHTGANGIKVTSTTVGGTSGEVKYEANLKSTNKLTKAAANQNTTTSNVYPVSLDTNGNLAVAVPWMNSVTPYANLSDFTTSSSEWSSVADSDGLYTFTCSTGRYLLGKVYKKNVVSNVTTYLEVDVQVIASKINTGSISSVNYTFKSSEKFEGAYEYITIN